MPREKLKKEKKPKVEKPLNPCHGAERVEVVVPTDHYALRFDFSPSNAQMIRYCEYHKYKMVMAEGDDGVYRPTFDETAMDKMLERYPQDKLFPLIRSYVQTQRCLGTYVEGINIRPDNRVGGEFLHVPKTGRLAMRNPNHQNQPRTSDPTSPYFKVRSMYIAAPGKRLLSRDFGGIEAVLTMYLSGVHADGTAKMGADDARQGLRLTGIDIHGYLSSVDIGQPADLSWSDTDLREYLQMFRKENRIWKAKSGLELPYEKIRDCNKTGLYGSLYGGGAGTLVRSQPDVFPNEMVAATVQGLIFELFPSVPRWWQEVCDEAERFGFVTTPDGYRQHFSDVFDVSFSKKRNRWEKKMGRTANECIAAKPQHLGMTFTAQGIDEFWEKYPEYRDGLRLTIHDEILGEWDDAECLNVNDALDKCMSTPMSFLPLPKEWGMGDNLVVKSEGKMTDVGGNWGEMRKIK